VKLPCEGKAGDCIKTVQHQASSQENHAEYQADNQISRLSTIRAKLLLAAGHRAAAASAEQAAAAMGHTAKAKQQKAAKQLLKAKAAAARAERSMGKPDSDDRDYNSAAPSSSRATVTQEAKKNLATAAANAKKAVFDGVSHGHSAADINHEEDDDDAESPVPALMDDAESPVPAPMAVTKPPGGSMHPAAAAAAKQAAEDASKQAAEDASDEEQIEDDVDEDENSAEDDTVDKLSADESNADESSTHATKAEPMLRALGQYQGEMQTMQADLHKVDARVAETKASNRKRGARLVALQARVHNAEAAQQHRSRVAKSAKAKWLRARAEIVQDRHSAQDTSERLASSITESRLLKDELHTLRD